MVYVTKRHSLEYDVGGDVRAEALHDLPHTSQVAVAFLADIGREPQVAGQGVSRQVVRDLNQRRQTDRVVANPWPDQPVTYSTSGAIAFSREDAIQVRRQDDRRAAPARDAG